MGSKCNKCGKPIKTPESLSRGFGPVCWGKLHGKTPRHNGHKVVRRRVKPKSKNLEDLIKPNKYKDLRNFGLYP